MASHIFSNQSRDRIAQKSGPSRARLRRWFTTILLVMLLVSGCAPTALPVTAPAASMTSSPIPSPSSTATATLTPVLPTITPSFTPVPQTILLRRKCGRDYQVRADQPVQLLYGGWGVLGKDLADQWTPVLRAELKIDGESFQGELQPPSANLPYNCITNPRPDLYWLYFTATVPGLAAGKHRVEMKFSADKALPDGTGQVFGPGPILEQTFFLMAQ